MCDRDSDARSRKWPRLMMIVSVGGLISASVLLVSAYHRDSNIGQTIAALQLVFFAILGVRGFRLLYTSK